MRWLPLFVAAAGLTIPLLLAATLALHVLGFFGWLPADWMPPPGTPARPAPAWQDEQPPHS